jgi:hypothetical protein
MTATSPTDRSMESMSDPVEHPDAARRPQGAEPTASTDGTSGHSVAGVEHEAITDQVLGRSLVVGTAAGVPLTWAVATALMLPFGFAIAASAAAFVGIASGPFFGAAAVLMTKVLRDERQARDAAAWR